MAIRKCSKSVDMAKLILTCHDSWSPLHELVPDPPLRHGHAISVDMAYSATLAFTRGLLSAADHNRLLTLFSRAGLAMDHAQFDAPLLERATAAILKTRDGKLRAAVPVSPMGKCVFLNDVSSQEMREALRVHKQIVQERFPDGGQGLDAFVDAGDTGYTIQGQPVEEFDAYVVDARPGETSGGVKAHTSRDGERGFSDGLKIVLGGLEGHFKTLALEGKGSP